MLTLYPTPKALAICGTNKEARGSGSSNKFHCPRYSCPRAGNHCNQHPKAHCFFKRGAVRRNPTPPLQWHSVKRHSLRRHVQRRAPPASSGEFLTLTKRACRPCLHNQHGLLQQKHTQHSQVERSTFTSSVVANARHHVTTCQPRRTPQLSFHAGHASTTSMASCNKQIQHLQVGQYGTFTNPDMPPRLLQPPHRLTTLHCNLRMSDAIQPQIGASLCGVHQHLQVFAGKVAGSL